MNNNNVCIKEQDKIFTYLGKIITDKEIDELRAEYPSCKVKEIKSYTYISFYEQGFSLCFYNKILDNIYVYREGVEGFKNFYGVVPYGITFKDLNINIYEQIENTNNW